MRLLTKTCSLFLVVGLAALISCGGGGGETAKEKVQLGKLSKTWTMLSTNGASLDGQDKTTLFTNFKVIVTGTYNKSNPAGPYNFSVSGSRQDPSPWPATGTWEFSSIGSNDSGVITRDDDIAISYVINSNGQLTLTFECATCDYPGGARAGSVNGTWTFVFN